VQGAEWCGTRPPTLLARSLPDLRARESRYPWLYRLRFSFFCLRSSLFRAASILAARACVSQPCASRQRPAAKRKHSLLSRRLKNLELAHSQDSEADTVKCSRTAEPLVQKRRKIAKEE
jgi:hypothetical protein